MEEVGSPRERQEENLGPSHRHPNPKGKGHEGVGDHQRLPHAEGGATDEARTSHIHDGTRGITRWDGARRWSALPSEVAQHIKEAMEPPWDNTGAILDFVYPVPGHPQCGRSWGTLHS